MEGSSILGSFCVARKIFFSDVASVASSARIEARRPTTNGAIIDGKTTMSRSGTRGSVVISGCLGMWVSFGFLGYCVARLLSCSVGKWLLRDDDPATLQPRNSA